MIKKHVFFICFFISMFSGCRNEDSGTIAELIGSPDNYGGTITLSINGPCPEINPLKDRSRSARSLYYLIYDNLIDIDHNLQFVPRLAKSWEISSDASKLTFHLRDDVHWHNDNLFTAGDVIYSFERYRELPDPECPGKKLFHRVLRLEAVNPYTITVYYDSPNILALADWIIEIVPKPADQPGSQPVVGTAIPVGSGPYAFSESFLDQQKISLDAFESYWNGRGHINRINIRFSSPGQDVRQLFASGELDHYHLNIEDATGESLKKLQKKMHVITYPGLEYYYIGWRCSSEHHFFSHRRIRKAMSLSLNRRKIHSDLFLDTSKLCDVPMPDWAQDKNVRSLPFSPTVAVDLLREVGCKDRNSDGIRELAGHEFTFTLIYLMNDQYAHRISEHFQASLRKIGVIMTPLGLPEQEFLRRINKKDFDAFLTSMRVSLRMTNLEMFMGSNDETGKENILGFYDPELNELLTTLFYKGSNATIDRLFYQIADRILQEQPCTFIIYKPAIHGLNKRIRMLDPARSGLWEWYPSILDWFVPQKLQVKQNTEVVMND